MNENRNPGIVEWTRRLIRHGAAAIGLGLAVAGTANAQQTIPPSQVPADWVRYAEGAAHSVTGWLRAENETGVRLRAYIEATRVAPDRPTPPLMIRLWVDATGTVSRIEFPPYADEQANADVRSLIVGRKLASAPPAEMRQPMLLAVQLDVRPPEPAAAAPVSAPTGDRT